MINLSSITLRRGPEPLLEDASVVVHPGQKIGLVGANGSGKSTLLALLLGEINLDAGEMSIPADWTLAHMAQQIDELDRAAIEFVIDGDERLRAAERAVATAERNNDGHAIATAHARLEEADGYTAAARAGSLLNGLGFKTREHTAPVGDFSGGWRIRLSLARALMTPSDLLLLDEPTNHLDMETAEWLEGWLGRYTGTLVVISHDRDFLDHVVERIVHIEHRKLNDYTGGYSSFERQRAEQLVLQQASYEKQQQKIAHMQSFVDRFRAQASKARQAQARIKAMERMEKVAPAHVDSPFDFSFPEPGRASSPLLHLDQVSLGYGNRVVLDSISTSLAPGDRIGLLGLNGAGKSTLVRALAGDLDPLSGQMTRSRGLEIGYFAQHQLEQLDSAASPLTHLQRLAPDEHEQRLRDYLGGFNFTDDMATRPVGGFSGGEKARLVLAMLVWQAPNLLLLDEPTNHLDLDMRHALTMALQGYEGAVVIVSHDRHLLRNTIDHFWLVADGRLTPFRGSLDDYRQWLAEHHHSVGQDTKKAASPAALDEHSAAARRARRRQDAARRTRLRPLQNRAKKLERELTEASDALRAIEAELADPETYSADQKQRLERLLARQAKARQQVEHLEAEWINAAEALENEERAQRARQ